MPDPADTIAETPVEMRQGLAADRTPASDPVEAEKGRAQAAIKTSRAVTGKTPEGLAPRPQSKEEYEAVLPGMQWVDPEGNYRTKPYEPLSPEDYRKVPEGADWVDPEGTLHTKPIYEDLGYTAQTLYSMATNDKERRNALEFSYPKRVKEEKGTGDLYVEEEGGKMRKPRGFMKSPLANITSGAAPVVGAVAGEIAGTAVMPGPGSIAGAAAGGVVGQGFNDLILKGLDIYDRSGMEEVGELAMSGTASGAGSAIGRLFGRSMLATSKISDVNPGRLANTFLETDPEGLRAGIAMAEKGLTTQPISPMYPGAPHLINIVEVYDRAMHPGKPPLAAAAKDYYEKQASGLLKEAGVEPPAMVSEPTATVPLKETGQKLLDKAREQVLAADAKLRAAYEARMAPLQSQVASKGGQDQRMTALRQAEKESRDAATKFVNAVYQDIQTDIDAAVKASGAGRNNGDLWKSVAEKLQAARKAFGEKANEQYTAWTEQFGEMVPPGTLSLAPEAESFLALVPPEFKAKYPSLIRSLSNMAEVVDETGAVIKPAVESTMGDLHGVRTMFRYGIDWEDLRSDYLNGALKKFQTRIDEVMHGKGGPKADPVREAGAQLDKIDDWYRQNGAIFEDKRTQAVISGLKGGEPADPQVLYSTLIQEGRSDLNRKVEQIVGPNLWRGIQAADGDALMQATMTEVPGQIDASRFIKGVLDRQRSGMLSSIHGAATAEKWLSQVQNLKMLDGKLPVDVRPGDKITDVIQKARAAYEAVQQEAKVDPLKLLSKEVKSAQAAFAKEASAVQKARSAEPLGFLYEPSTGANEAAKKILGSEDLLLAAKEMFTPESEEFKSLQKSFMRQMLEGTMTPGDKSRLGKYSEEAQRLMFPGVTYDQMQLLAKEMDQLMGTRGLQETAKSMAAQTYIEHPKLPFVTRKLSEIPIAGVLPRMAFSSYFQFIRWASTRPATMRYLEKNLASGDAAARAKAKATLKAQFQRSANIFGALGSGIDESQRQATGDSEDPGQVDPQAQPQ